MLTQAGHWSWKMSIINYIFYLSVIAFLAVDCSPAFCLFQGTEQLFISILHSVFFSVFLLPSEINTACFRTSLFSSLIFSVLPVSTVSYLRKGGPSGLWNAVLNLSSSQGPQILTTSWTLKPDPKLTEVSESLSINFSGLWIRTRLLSVTPDWNLAKEKTKRIFMGIFVVNNSPLEHKSWQYYILG